MNPITKFEWKDNIEQEKDLLEYISILEELYIPDFDYDTDSPYYVSIRPRACFSPSYNKVKSQTKHVWLLTLL